jgi:hypothetical protein
MLQWLARSCKEKDVVLKHQWRITRSFSRSHTSSAAKIHRVAIKLTSATKIINAAIWHSCAALLVLLSFVCEGELVVTCALYHRLDSLFFRDALQHAKQLFSTRLSKKTKYCLMRGCEKILCGYLYVSDLAFFILKEISIFKFPKRFLEISSRDLTSFLLQLIYRPCYQSINVLPFALAGSTPCKQQSDILHSIQNYETHTHP